MIQVIQRAFTLLFAIAEEPQKVHGISELAELIHVGSGNGRDTGWDRR